MLRALQHDRILLDGSPSPVFPALLPLEHRLEQTRHRRLMVGEVVDNGVGAGVEGVCAYRLILPGRLCVVRINGFAHPYSSARGIVHVEDRRIRIQTGGVEVIGVFSSEGSKGGEVSLVDGFLHCFQAFGHNFFGAMLEEGGGGDGLLHAGGGGDVFLRGGGDEDDSAHVGPVRGRGDFVGDAVAAVWVSTFGPGNVAAH